MLELLQFWNISYVKIFQYWKFFCIFLLYKSKECLKDSIYGIFYIKRYSISEIFKTIFPYKRYQVLKMLLFWNILCFKIFHLWNVLQNFF